MAGADAPSAPDARALADIPPWWPLREASTRVEAGGLGWHVQEVGPRHAPVALLLHGTGSGTHTWRHLAPLLARHFHVVAPDLPGHAHTRTPPTQPLSLPAVAAAVGSLLTQLHLQPALVVGHSAGAAVALQMVLDGLVHPRLVVSINGALLPLQGPLGRLFLPIARVLAANPLVPGAFAAWAGFPGVTQRLLDGTGSRIDALGQRCYAELVSEAAHAGGALRLMASWDLAPLEAALPRLDTPLVLLAADGDRTLPPVHAQRVARVVPHATLQSLPGLGHLAHEEDAAVVAQAIEQAWRHGDGAVQRRSA